MSIDIKKLKKTETFCKMNEEKYKNYIKNSIKDPFNRKMWDYSFCSDPDDSHKHQDSNFYNMIKNYLNDKDEDRNKDKKWKYSFIVENCKSRPRGYIQVYDENNNPILKLRSDQFGFSRPKHRTWENYKDKNKYKYPYTKYLVDISRNNYDNEVNIINTIILIIKNTRSIGGSFLWPIIKQGKQIKSIFNMHRGVGSYIDDRVDKTLYEIKQFYCCLKKYNNSKNQLEDIKKEMNKKYILLRYEDSKQIFEWLKHFNTFAEYVEFFSFQDFVDIKSDYKIYNLTSDPENKTLLINPHSEKRVYEMNIGELENMLININNQTVDRTNRILKKPNETNKK